MGLRNHLNGKVSHLGKSSQAGHPSAQRMRTESRGPHSHPSLCHTLCWNKDREKERTKRSCLLSQNLHAQGTFIRKALDLVKAYNENGSPWLRRKSR